MDKRIIAVIAGAIAIIVIVGGFIWFQQSRAAEEDAVKPGEQYVMPTVAPISPEEPGPATDGDHPVGLPEEEAMHGDGYEHEHGVDHGEVVDLSNSEAVAEAVIREFLTIDLAESAESREARIAPYLAAGASVPELPALAKPGGYDLVGLTTQFTIVEIPDVEIYSVSADNQSFVYAVSVKYDVAYTSPSQSQKISNRQSWKVTLPADPTVEQKVQSITEPTH